MIAAMNFKPFDKGSLRGFFDLRYHGLTIKGCRLMAGNNGLWIALPQKQAEENGEVKYYDQMFLTKPEAEHVRRLAIADLQTQGHIERPKQDRGQQRPRQQHFSPEGEDLSEHYTNGPDDIPF